MTNLPEAASGLKGLSFLISFLRFKPLAAPGGTRKRSAMNQQIESKLVEHHFIATKIVEMAEMLDMMKSKASLLEGEIIEYLAAHPEDYNVGIGKKMSVGIASDIMFKVSFSEGIVRAKAKSERDQEWLQNLPPEYTRSSLALDKRAIETALKHDETNEKELKRYGIVKESKAQLKYGPKYSAQSVEEMLKTAKEMYEAGLLDG